MMIYTAKLNKKLLFSVLAVIVIVALAIAFGLPEGNKSQTTMDTVKIREDADVISFVNALGYETADETLAMREVVIPEEWDETYENYNALQKKCGFDLEKYKGKTVCLYTVDVVNHPESDVVIAEVMVHKKKAIGGSVYTKNLDGFMYGLEKTQQSVKQ
ncbi:MAG: DUF4830 domain-containing protein [Clostridia bacterium]|nr:DUF4830 domain-containing protein [Clostridia bacterium]MBR5265340.1 DUF4830 domain-containing protein [Clostridia bacterium]